MTSKKKAPAKPTTGEKNYAVGYGRPPKASQFKPGHSGNPKGRPRGLPTASDIFFREAARFVRIRIGDDVVSISKLEAAFRQLFNKAAAGDPRAINLVLLAHARLSNPENVQDEAKSTDHLPEALIPDAEMLERMISRFDHLRKVRETRDD